MERSCSCCNALENAIITREDLIPDKVKKDLDIIVGKHIK
jgi:hypothetical protein